MPKLVQEMYPQLWHYTTAIGLLGILESQQLWATNISYLNDAEEQTGFFDRRLQTILYDGVKQGISESVKNPEGLSYINSLGGSENAQNYISNQILDALRLTTLQLQAYVTSFCAPTNSTADDGLLSQWRGYGHDGGYAIVFNSQGIDDLMKIEMKTYFYSFGHWGDVDYFDEGGNYHEEAIEWERAIHDTAASIVAVQDAKVFHAKAEDFFQPILALATRHKHGGFREEAEVRIAVITSAYDELPKEAFDKGDTRPKKPIRFRNHNGTLIPYISLFEHPDKKVSKLPIDKIVIGPDPDKYKRQKSVEKLLSQLQIDASVVSSEIPYLGT